MASDYLESEYSGATVKRIEAETAAKDMEYVLTEFASGNFDWQGKRYGFVVDTETGEVYTSVLLEEIEKGLCEAILQNLGIDSREAAGVNCRIRYMQGGGSEEGKENWRWVDFANVFPEGKTVEELLQEILTDAEAYSLSINIQYKGGEIPLEIMEAEAPVPALRDIGIYHIAEEHELYEEVKESAFLPWLSEEIFRRSYTHDTAEYIRNQVLEQNDFRVVYNAYQRTREQDKVTEAVIEEKDIELTVRDDYIALSCAKEHFAMYLATTDREAAQKYLYAFDYAISEKKPREGNWYSYEEFYIYSDSRSREIPYEFNSRHEEKNVIFSKENYDVF